MDGTIRTPFNIESYLATVGVGRSINRLKSRQIIFPQGSAADAVFYLQSGQAKLSVVSKNGKEATVTLLAAGDFFGEESMAGTGNLRTATATALVDSLVLRITTEQMKQVLHQEDTFSDFFLRFIILRVIKTQDDLIDQLFNSSEKRLARTLLLMAEFGNSGQSEGLLPQITQETLAAMVGTTRSRISFFLNRFRKLGLIDYHGRIRVNKTMLNTVLRDELPDQNASKPVLLGIPPSEAQLAKRTRPNGAAHPEAQL
jgi:CRP/FNR family transcriptional regulator, cyclic AMP receptor protein